MVLDFYYQYLDTLVGFLALVSFLIICCYAIASKLFNDDKNLLLGCNFFKFILVTFAVSILSVICFDMALERDIITNFRYAVVNTEERHRKVWVNGVQTMMPRTFFYDLLKPVPLSNGRKYQVPNTEKIITFDIGGRVDSFSVSKNLYDSAYYMIYSLNNKSKENKFLYQVKIQL